MNNANNTESTSTSKGNPTSPPTAPKPVLNADEVPLDKNQDPKKSSIMDSDTLFSVSKMAGLLDSGTDTQRAVVIFELQQLLDHCLEDTLRILVPVLCLHVHEWRTDLQINAAESLLDVVHKSIPSATAKMIAAASFRVVNTATVDTIYETWGEILVAVIPKASWSEEELLRVLALIDAHATRSSEVSRKLAARVLGSLSGSDCLSKEQVSKYILERSLKLCSDEHVEVRGMITESLAYIGAKMPLSDAQIWHQLKVLLDDKDSRIHAAALRSLAQILNSHRDEVHDSELYKTALPEVFLEHCAFAKKAASEDQRMVDDDSYLLLEIFSEIYGQLLYALRDHLVSEQAKKDAYKSFLGMAICNGPVVRRHCAFNVPCVAQVLGVRLKNEMSNLVEFLSRDPDAETRWNIAAGIHETISFLVCDESIDNLFKSVVALLQDKNPLVRMNTLENFDQLLRILTKEMQFNTVRKLAPVFDNLTLLSEGNWRTQLLLADQIRKSLPLIPPEALRSHIIPLIYQMAEDSTYLVRKGAMCAVVEAIRYIPNPEERNQVMFLFQAEWAKGGVFWMRIAFLEGSAHALKVYSANLFKTLFAKQLLKLSGDPIGNVRLKLARMMIDLAPACHDLLEYETALRLLQDDEDEDISNTLTGITKDIENAILKANSEEYKKTDKEKEEFEKGLLYKKGRKLEQRRSNLHSFLSKKDKEREKGKEEGGNGGNGATGGTDGTGANSSNGGNDLPGSGASRNLSYSASKTKPSEIQLQERSKSIPGAEAFSNDEGDRSASGILRKDKSKQSILNKIKKTFGSSGGKTIKKDASTSLKKK